ncbi:MAG: oxygen-independent coproporphyrinogen III oxidase [Lachnospiraceae bacterium]|nr:oxygen-independent coproporphyrinogen III oxidase [Lachnospiraceae bacterium]
MPMDLELYLHIPFCIKKCNYCDFLSMPAEEEIRRHYINMLLREIRKSAEVCREYRIISVFLGGGTPSMLEGRQTTELIKAVKQNFDLSPEAEITIECNPGTLTRQKLSDYWDVGINRLSIGLQSAIDSELKLLGRIHTFEQFLENFKFAREIGFQNINVDLIFGIPGQTKENWSHTLQKVLGLGPEHISAYSLIIEEGTPFYERYGEDEIRREQGKSPKHLPEEETERDMYQMTGQILKDKGYQRYEISNYARPGLECRHNTGYWQGTPYLGLGLGSASLMKHKRFSNSTVLEEYLKGNFQNLGQILNTNTAPCLSRKQQMEEFMFLGLRMMEGVSKEVFRRRFGQQLEEIYGQALQKLKGQGLVEQKNERVCLTEEGIALSNYVLCEFLL